jgi:Cellulase (glycosyl hydrolase family 5)
MRKRTRHSLVAVTLAVALIGLAAAPPAGASHDQFTVLDPTPSLLNGESAARRSDILDRLQALGVDTVRIQVQWRFLAPSPESSTAPAGFDASDPGDYPPRAFDVLDSVVRGAVARGMDVLLTPTSPVPDWATPNGRGGLYAPHVNDFEQFVQALGDRYSGTCVAPKCSPGADGDPLPRVDHWAVWNEPNLRTFLRPQRTLGGTTVSGTLYRGLFLAAQRALAFSGHKQDTLLLGDTSPSRGSASTPPLEFLRQVFCLSSQYRPLGSCQPIDASGWAHHPYNPHIPPWQKPKRTNRSIVSTGNINKLVRALKRVAKAGATTARLPVYVTEYGIESFPQGGFGVSPQRQAEFLGIAEYLLYRNPWVKSFAQYLLDDDGDPRQLLSFQTGLRFADGFPKPSYDAFPVTLVARRTRAGDVELWGHVRPGEGPYRVEIRYRDGVAGSGQPLTVQETDRNGYFRFQTGSRQGREWQATCELPNGAILQGPFIRSYRFD